MNRAKIYGTLERAWSDVKQEIPCALEGKGPDPEGLDQRWRVSDPDGGVWAPSAQTVSELYRLAEARSLTDSAMAEVLAMAAERDPDLGEWKS